jgi:hypothetical protein
MMMPKKRVDAAHDGHAEGRAVVRELQPLGGQPGIVRPPGAHGGRESAARHVVEVLVRAGAGVQQQIGAEEAAVHSKLHHHLRGRGARRHAPHRALG